MNYIAGDALAVIPSNDPALADALIDKLGLSPDSQVPTPEGETASLKDALVHCYDITNVNKALLTKWAAASGSQELDALLAGDKDALSDFLWGRDMLDLATEYPASFKSSENSLIPSFKPWENASARSILFHMPCSEGYNPEKKLARLGQQWGEGQYAS